MFNVETTRAYRALVVGLFLAALLVGMLSLQGKVEAQENAKENGPIVATDNAVFGQEQIVKIDPATGEKTPIPGAIGRDPSVTPDGKTVIYSGPNEATTDPGFRDLYAVPIDGSTAPTKMEATLPGPPENTSRDVPVVSPDGQTVYFQYAYSTDTDPITGLPVGRRGLASVPISGGDVTEIVNDDEQHGNLTITPDGQNLVWDNVVEDNGRSITTMPVQGGTMHIVARANDTIFPVPNSCWGQRIEQPTLSPDGQTVAMKSRKLCNIVGQGSWTETAIYTVPFSTTSTSTPVMVPNTDVRRTSSATEWDEVSYPAYSPDGQLLAYNVVHQNSDESRRTEIRAVPVTGGDPAVIMPSTSNTLLLHNWWAPRSSQAEVLEVRSTNPANETTEVEKETNPTVEFNINLDPATVDGESVKLEVYNSRQQRWVPVSSTPSYDDASKTISVNPVETLGTQKQYRVTLSTAIKSSTGKELASPYSWSFTTEK